MFGWEGELLALFIGLALGSYTVTAALRSVQPLAAAPGRSRCDGCGARLSFAQTVPVVSYLRLRGACSTCGDRIEPWHLAGEIAGGLILAGAARLADPLCAVLTAVLGLILLASAVIDAKTLRLPDVLTLAAAALAAGLGLRQGPGHLALGAALGLGIAGVLQGLRWARRRAGRDPGLGFGDVKLVAALSLWLGAAAPWMLAIAALLTLGTVALLRPADRRLPFGPALALAGWGVGFAMELGLWPQTI